MSHREQSAWAELIALFGVWGVYFFQLFGAVASGALAADGFVGAMGLIFAACVVLSIILSVAIDVVSDLRARRSRAPVRDEREAWAGLRATRLAHGTLVTLILLLAALGFLFGAFGGEGLEARMAGWLDRVLDNGLVLFANGAMASLILAEIVHYAGLIVFLRRDR